MSTPAPEHRTEPPLRAVRRHLPSAVIAFAALWILVSLAAFALPVKYSATATVQVYPVAGGQAANATNVSPVNVSTEARAASSDTVLQAAAGWLGGIDVAVLRSSIEVDAPDGSQNLVVVGTAGSAAAAADRANAVARAYLAARGEMANSVVLAADTKLKALINGWKADPSLKSRVGELELSRAALAQVNTVPGVLVDPAAAAGATATGRAVWGVAAGFVLGLLGAAAVVMWREKSSRLSYDAARVAARTGHRVLDWDGDAEGVRRLLLGVEPGAAWSVTGDAVASRRFAEALAEGLRERGELVEQVHVSDAGEVDAGAAGRRLLRAAARGGLVASVDPELGFSRFVRLSQRTQPVLVVTKRSRIDVVRAAVGDLDGAGSVVFARPSALQVTERETEFASAAERALAFERAARAARALPSKSSAPVAEQVSVAPEAPTATASTRSARPAGSHGTHAAVVTETSPVAAQALAADAETIRSEDRERTEAAVQAALAAVAEAAARSADRSSLPELPDPAEPTAETAGEPAESVHAEPEDTGSEVEQGEALEGSSPEAGADKPDEATEVSDEPQPAPNDQASAEREAAPAVERAKAQPKPSAAPKPGPRGPRKAPVAARKAPAAKAAQPARGADAERELMVALSVSSPAAAAAAAASQESEPAAADERSAAGEPREGEATATRGGGEEA